MVAPRFTKIFSITLLVALLTSSAQSADCPSDAKVQTYKSEKLERYIVVVDEESTSAKTDKSVVEDHFDTMTACYGKKVKRRSDASTSSKSDNDTLKDLSAKGFFAAYTGNFGEKFVNEQLKNMKGIKYIEKDQIVKANFAVPRKLYKRAVDENL
jgi:hypothetical protein